VPTLAVRMNLISPFPKRLRDYALDTSKVHVLRHTFAVGMMKSGAPITDLAAHQDHTDIKVTHTYTKEIMGDENPYGEKLSTRFGIKHKSR
jgi:integrase